MKTVWRNNVYSISGMTSFSQSIRYSKDPSELTQILLCRTGVGLHLRYHPKLLVGKYGKRSDMRCTKEETKPAVQYAAEVSVNPSVERVH